MKRILLYACILVMAALPATASAQGLPSQAGFPGIGGFASIFGNGGLFGEAGPGLAGPPTFYVGYLGYSDGMNFGVGIDSPLSGFNGVDHTYDLGGVALGLSQAFTVSDGITVLASGWWIVPSGNTTSIESYDVTTGPTQRFWSVETNWWWVEALVALNLGGGAAVLGGFRFDRIETTFKDPEPAALFTLTASSDKSDVQSNGFIPLLGLLYSAGSATNTLTAYFVGFPTLLGHVDYNQTLDGTSVLPFRLLAAGDYNSGFFFETGIQYNRRIMGDANLGAFFRYNATRGAFSGTASLETGGGFLAPETSAFRGGVNRSSFTVGGALNLPFRLPFT